MNADDKITTRIHGIPVNVGREIIFDFVSEPGETLRRKWARRIDLCNYVVRVSRRCEDSGMLRGACI